MNLGIFVPPIIGGVIGYITNDIAIKMLFHPRHPIYIGKWRVPFTPGLIPKEKDRVARSIGNVVSTQLLNSDILVEVLTSDEMTRKFQEKLNKVVDDNRANTDTLYSTLCQMAPRKAVDSATENVKKCFSELLYEKLTTMKFGEKVSSHVLQRVQQSLGNKIRGFGFNLLDDETCANIAASVGDLMDKAIADNSQDIIRELVDSESENILNMRICDLIWKYEEKLPEWLDFFIRSYVSIIRNNLEQVLNGINIGKIVEDRISSFDVVQLEQMIFGIMKKELNAIVYLGALLGFLMGWLNLLLGNLF